MALPDPHFRDPGSPPAHTFYLARDWCVHGKGSYRLTLLAPSPPHGSFSHVARELRPGDHRLPKAGPTLTADAWNVISDSPSVMPTSKDPVSSR